MLNKIKNNKGSTLLMVMVVISVLSMLGTALISLSVVNYKSKIVERNKKRAFYLAEAGLEEAYARVGKVVEEAIKEGKDQVKNKLRDYKLSKSFIEHERNAEKDLISHRDSVFIEGIDGEGEIVKEKLDILVNEWFKYYYAKYINEHMEAELNGYTTEIVESTMDNNSATISANKTSDYVVIDTCPDVTLDINNNPNSYINRDKYVVELNSEFTHEGIQKEVQATLTINIPEYNGAYYVKNEIVEIKDNILWTRAITTDESLKINGEDVTINGHIYTGHGETTNKNHSNAGGLIVGDSSKGILNMNGNVYSRDYVLTKANNSEINIKGNVYTNNLVSQGNNNKITLKDGILVTKDDIELNGEKSHINIDGSYYGFSDGSGSTISHSGSSSIVINSADIGDAHGSTLTISGVNSVEAKNIYAENGVFIRGTAYIKNLIDPDNNTVDYQTGESVSVKGNYLAYTRELDYSDDKKTVRDYVNRNINEGSLEFKFLKPLVLIHSNTGTNLTAIDKSYYFKYSQEDNHTGIKTDGITINEVKYNTGAVIENSSTIKVGLPGNAFDTLFGKILEDYKANINRLGETTDTNTKLDITQRLNSNYSEIDTVQGNEIILVNKDDSKDINIKGDGTKITIKGFGSNKEIMGTDIKGIIVTKGEVTIDGKVNYSGTIISEKDITIKGHGLKTITYDKKYVLRKIWQDSDLSKVFIYDKSDIKELEESDKSKQPLKKHVLQSDAGVEDIDTYLKYDKVIDMKWKQIK